MTAEQLKNSILQMAVSGKLVQQDPNDEPSSVLLEQIRKEREQLSKEKKTNKEKNSSYIFRGIDNLFYEKNGSNEPVSIDEEVPFIIPDSWAWIRLSNLCNIINGFTPSRTNSEYWDNGTIPWFTIEDVHSQGRRIHYTAQKITGKALGKNSNRILPANTVLLCCTASVGEYAITEIALTTNQQFNGLVIHDWFHNVFDSEFLLLLVQTFKNRLISVAGKTTFNFVSVKKLGQLLVPIPPYKEQIRIVNKYNECLPLIKQYCDVQLKLDNLNSKFPDKLEQSILQTAIQGKLVEQNPNDESAQNLMDRIHSEKDSLVRSGIIRRDREESIIYKRDGSYYEMMNGVEHCIDDEIPFSIPDSWCWSRIGSVFSLQAGKNIKASDISQERTEGRYPCFGGNGVRGYVDYYNHNGDYPLIGRQGALCGNVNRAAGKFYATEHAVCVSTFSSTNISWACIFLKALNLNQYATATAQPGLAVSNINKVLIPVPPIEEQGRIAEAFDYLMLVVNNLGKTI